MYTTTLTTIKVKLYPNYTQKSMLDRHLGSTRCLWNYMLDYSLTNGYQSYYDMTMMLPKLKQEHTWLKKIYSQSLQETLRKLAITTKMYFKYKHKGYGKPKFKRKYEGTDYFIIPQYWRLTNKKLKLPKIGEIKISHIPDNILDITNYKQVIVKKDIKGNYIANIVVEAVIATDTETIEDTIGIDVNSSNMLVDSKGNQIDSLHKHHKILKLYSKLKKLQAKLANKQKGSLGFKATKLLIAKLWYKIRMIKHDIIHKVSHYYSKYKFIKMENLNIKKMTKNTRGTKDNPNQDSKRKSNLNRTILANNWLGLRYHIAYKAERLGHVFELVDPMFTSQTCSACGYISKQNRESQSVFRCVSCGHTLNADHNAAINIARA